MDVYLKELTETDGHDYYDLLIELASYDDALAKPVPEVFPYEEFKEYLQDRVRMKNKDLIPKRIKPTTTYWVMGDEQPIGVATLKQEIDVDKPGGNFGCCLKKDYHNKGIGVMVASELSNIASHEYGLDSVIYTSKDNNLQSQRSIIKIGEELVSIHDGYHFYKVDISDKKERGR